MEDEIGIRNLINEKTNQFGIGNLEAFSPKIQEQLYQIEKYIQDITSEQVQIVKKVKEYTKVNVLSISSGAKVQRSSVYNHPNTLKLYIDERIKEMQIEDILGTNELEKYKQRNNELSDCLDGLQENIIENHILLLKIKELEAELKNLNDINQSITKQNNSLSTENKKLYGQLNKQSNNNVIPLRTDT